MHGYFRVAFKSHVTDPISVSHTSNELKNALELPPAIGTLSVSRNTCNGGDNKYLVILMKSLHAL